MKIETIEEGRGGRVRITFADGRTLRAYPSVVAQHGLHPGMELPEGAFPALEESCGAASARERAVKIISAAPMSRKNLLQRLMDKGETRENAEAAVDWLAELGFLDDRALALQLVHSSVSRGYGPGRIRQTLYAKGIPREFWEEALATVPPQDDAIDTFLARRLRENPDRKEIKRAADALMRRGHSWSDIRRGLERYTSELPDE